MKQARLIAALALGLMGTIAASPVIAGDAPPPVANEASVKPTAETALVADFYTKLVAVMKNGEELGFAGRYKELQPAVEKAFNLPLMTRVAIGPSWNDAQPDEQKTVTDAFTSFSVANYASRFTHFNGETFAVVDETPASGGGTIVETTLTTKEGKVVALNYLVRPDDNGKPRIIDVLLDASISELATRRAEFSAVVKRDGFSALATMLSEKSKKMGPS